MKGKIFYSCSKYPECKFSVWERPLKAPCEVCGEEKFVMGKPPKQKVFGCSRGDCPYQPAYTGEPESAETGAESAEKPKGRRGGFRRKAAAASE